MRAWSACSPMIPKDVDPSYRFQSLGRANLDEVHAAIGIATRKMVLDLLQWLWQGYTSYNGRCYGKCSVSSYCGKCYIPGYFYDAPLDKLTFGLDLCFPIEESRDETEGFVYDVETSFYASVDFRKAIGPLLLGRLTQDQLVRLQGQIDATHARGLKVRYWVHQIGLLA